MTTMPTATNGMLTPALTPSSETKKFSPPQSSTNGSPRQLATDPVDTPSKTVVLPERVKQEEDTENVSKTREDDIYAEAALACSIENPESCLMCSG